LRQRFSIGRVCVVADRGMISAATIEGLEARKLEYILGARERSDAIVRKIVLENEDLFTPLLVERKAGETQLFVKQVKIEGKRYIVCRNEAEAEKDRKDREAIVAALDAQLKKGDKALVGNSAYRRYLRKIGKAKDNRSFEIRRWKARRRGAFRWNLRAADQHESDAAAGRAPLSRLAAGRKSLFTHESDHAYAANLPFVRRCHPWPCVLFLPGPRDAKASRRPLA